MAVARRPAIVRFISMTHVIFIMTHVIKAMREPVLKSNSSPFSPQKNSCFNDDQASMAYVSLIMATQPFDPSNPLNPLEPFDPVERPFLPKRPFAREN
jgi:hypothetical protein